MKSDERNVQPNKSKTNNFQQGSMERKLKHQEREQARFDRETDAMVNKIIRDQKINSQILSPTEKKCGVCNTTKPVTSFSSTKKTPQGKYYLRWRCKDCDRAAAKDRYNQNREAVIDRANKRNYLKSYGLTIEEVDAMIKAQNNKCKICNKTSNRKLHVDHCHTTGKIRGMLCHNCNTALGLFKEDINIMAKAMDYLQISAV